MLPEKEVIYSFASEAVPIVEESFVKIFDDFERALNIVETLYKSHFKKIVSRLYQKGLFDENVFKLIKNSSKSEDEALNKSLRCCRYTRQTTSEKIANAMRRCTSLSDAKIIAEKIAGDQHCALIKILEENFKAITQQREQLRTKMKNINEQGNRRPTTKTSKLPKQKRGDSNGNSKEEISGKSNTPSSTKTASVVEKIKLNCSIIILNCQSFLVNFKFDWKYFRKKHFS